MAPDLFAGLYLVEKPKKVVGGEVKKEGKSKKVVHLHKLGLALLNRVPFLITLSSSSSFLLDPDLEWKILSGHGGPCCPSTGVLLWPSFEFRVAAK